MSHIEDILMKLIFFIQDNELVRKYNVIWDKVNKVIKNNLTVSLYSQ